MKSPKKASLCWFCENCYGGCSWAEDFTPVEGWTAEPTLIKEEGERDIPSYKVLQCPKFKKDEKFLKKTAGIRGVMNA